MYNVFAGIRIGPLRISWLHRSSYCVGSFLSKVRDRITSGESGERNLVSKDPRPNGEDYKNIRNESGRDGKLFKDYESYVRRADQIEERSIEKRLELHDLIQKIQDEVLGQFDITGGQIDFVPCDINEVLQLSEGWKAKLIHRDESEDIFICPVEKGAELSEHKHFQLETFMSIAGSVECISQDEVDGKMIAETIKAGVAKKINSNCNHVFKALTKGKNIVIFQPPITKPKD